MRSTLDSRTGLVEVQKFTATTIEIKRISLKKINTESYWYLIINRRRCLKGIKTYLVCPETMDLEHSPVQKEC